MLKRFLEKVCLRKLLFSVFWILGLPLIITIYLYPPTSIKLGECSGKKEIITSEEISKVSAKGIFADILQIPLNLKWYDIHIFAKDVNCRKPAYIFISFTEGDPERYSTTSLLKPSLSDEFFVPGEDAFKIPENGKGQFTYLATDFFSFGMSVGGCSEPIITNLEEVKKLPGGFGLICEVYAKPYMPAWIAQYLVIVIISLFIFSSFLAILNFIIRRKKYN